MPELLGGEKMVETALLLLLFVVASGSIEVLTSKFGADVAEVGGELFEGGVGRWVLVESSTVDNREVRTGCSAVPRLEMRWSVGDRRAGDGRELVVGGCFPKEREEGF